VEVADGVHRIDTMLGPRTSSIYLVVGARACLLFDVGVAGDPSTVVGPYMDAQGIGRSLVEWVVISHCDVDHFGGLADARATFPGARVVAHVSDRAAITHFGTYLQARGMGFVEPYGLEEAHEVIEWARSVVGEGPVAGAVVGSELIDLGARDVEVLHVPGHTRGHLALRDTATGALVIADAALGPAVLNADGTAAFPPTYRHVRPYLSSVAKLDKLGSALLLTSHYPTYSGDQVRAFLNESAGFANDLGRRVAGALKSVGECTLAELVGLVNDGFGNWPVATSAGALAFPVAGHVEDLAEEGRVIIEDGRPSGGVVKIKAVA
jgi:glyoxylase-like metal-dependent hydrolase (beta-lactamase superfamily II)